MKHLIYFDDYLVEAILDINSIYTKYYNNIERDIFDKIIEADPTTVLKDNKVGAYSKWLLKLYDKKKLKLEDLYKATEYLTAFKQFSHKISDKDINSYLSLPELFKAVEPFLGQKGMNFTNDDERKLAGQFKEIFRNEEYRIIIPLTLKASKYFGRGTEWCTTKSDSFAEYTKKQDADDITPYNLYIFYTKDLKDRMQFHFKERQFMDVNDDYFMDIDLFFEENEDIFDLFNKHFDVETYFGPGEIFWDGVEKLPEIIVGDLTCDTDVDDFYGCPHTVDGNFIIDGLEVDSLHHAPEDITGNFYCRNTPNLSKNEIMKYYRSGAVKGTIFSDYGTFKLR